MPASNSWALLTLLREGPYLALDDRPDRDYVQLLELLRRGRVIELEDGEHALFRSGARGWGKVMQLIGHFFCQSVHDQSVLLVWREIEGSRKFARVLNRNQTHMAAQIFSLPIAGVLPPPRFHHGICLLEEVWDDEWFALPGGSSGWVSEQSEPLGDTIDVVLGFYDSFPALPRDRLVYMLTEATARRVLETRWQGKGRLVTLENASTFPARKGSPVDSVDHETPTTSKLEDLLNGEEVGLPISIYDDDAIRERLFMRGCAVEIPCGLYSRLTTESPRIFRTRQVICCRDEEGRAHLFWKKGARCYTRLLSTAEARGLIDEVAISA